MNQLRGMAGSTLRYVAAAGLVVGWVLLCHAFRSAGEFIGVLLATGAVGMLLGALAIQHWAPDLSGRVKWALMAGLALKIILSVWYFDSFFITRAGESPLLIGSYGDSQMHHTVAVAIMNHWMSELPNPAVAVQIAQGYIHQWGYGIFLSIIYYIAGPDPAAGVIVNGLLMFLACLLSYRLFRLVGMAEHQAVGGLILLLINPVLWLWSSLLYKDSILYLMVVACTLTILRLIERYDYRQLLLVTLLLVVLVPIRYSYTVPLLLLLTFGAFFLRPNSWRNAAILFLTGLAISLLIIAESNWFFQGSGGVVDVTSIIVEAKPEGGRFLSSTLGAQPTLSNFYFVLPARAIYILMIPMPWFGGSSMVEQIDYVLSHIDAVFYFSLLGAVIATALGCIKAAAARPPLVLLALGILYFCMPLFFFTPSRRYISIAEIFFLGYAVPYLLTRIGAARSVVFAILAIAAVQILYYFAMDIIAAPMT